VSRKDFKKEEKLLYMAQNENFVGIKELFEFYERCIVWNLD
jgi:hypothetical protein